MSEMHRFSDAAVQASKAAAAKLEVRGPGGKPKLAPALARRIGQTIGATSGLPDEEVTATEADRVLEQLVSEETVTTPVMHDEAFIPDYGANIQYAAAAPNASAEAVSLDLPSGFAFYPFKDVFTKPLRLQHLSKLTVADNMGSTQHIVEVVSDLLYTTDSRYAGVPLGWYLTVPDFFYVLYYHRLNSFTKSAFRHKTFCNNPKHIKDVFEKKTRKEESLKIETVILKTTLDTRKLAAIPTYDQDLMGSDFYLYPSTMRDVVELMDDPNFKDAAWREDAMQSTCLRLRSDPQASLSKRIAIARDMTPDQAFVLADFRKATEAYGIDEWINVTCKECGHSMRTKVRISAHSFLPSDQV